MIALEIPASISPTTVLPNGFTVVAAKPLRDGFWVVLAVEKRYGGQKIEYATWDADPDSGTTYSGHYFSDFDKAVKDFNRRR